MSELTPQEQAKIEARFENFDPDKGTTYDVGTAPLPAHLQLLRAQAARALLLEQADTVMREAVDAARAEGLSWHKIGGALGTTGEAARQRYGRRQTA